MRRKKKRKRQKGSIFKDDRTRALKGKFLVRRKKKRKDQKDLYLKMVERGLLKENS